MNADIEPSIMTTTFAPQVLLVDHFQVIKLPTFAHEYGKVGADYASDSEPEQIPGSGVGRL